MTTSGSSREPLPRGEQELPWEAAAGAHEAPATEPEAAAARSSGPQERGLPGRGGSPPAWTQSLTSTAAQPGPAGLFYADVPNRIIAYIVDLLALAVVGFLLALTLGGLLGGVNSAPGSIQGGGGELNAGAFLVVAIIELAISLGYFGYSWTTFRATPGMRLLGLRVGDETDGHAMAWSQALVRWLVIGIPSILATFVVYVSGLLGAILSIAGLGWLVVLLVTTARSPSRQGLHDRSARTIVVRAPRRAT